MRIETMSPVGQSRLRLALYIILALAWVIIAIAQFAMGPARASSDEGAVSAIGIESTPDTANLAAVDADSGPQLVAVGQEWSRTGADEPLRLQGGEKPAATPSAPRLSINSSASQLDKPRWFCVLSNGDVLIAENDSPEASTFPDIDLVKERIGSERSKPEVTSGEAVRNRDSGTALQAIPASIIG